MRFLTLLNPLVELRRMLTEAVVESWEELAASKQRPARRPNYVRPSLEWLTPRILLAGTWYWFPTDFTTRANVAANWNSQPDGKGTSPANPPGAGDTVIFDGSNAGGNQPCNWNYANNAVSGVTVQNGYNQKLTLNNTLTTAGQFKVSGQAGTKLTLSPSVDAADFVQLTNGAGVLVSSGGELDLIGSTRLTFFKGDGKASEVLDNAGTTVYAGVGSGLLNQVDNLKIPVLNEGTFQIKGGSGGPLNLNGVGLDVSGSDTKTNGVSWYQNNSSAETDFYGEGFLVAESNYTQTAGTLQTKDATTAYLIAGQQTNTNGTVSISGGSIKVMPGSTTTYGDLEIEAVAFNLQNAGIYEKVNGQTLSQHDQIGIKAVGTGGNKCQATFGTGSKFHVVVNGRLISNQQAETLLSVDGGWKAGSKANLDTSDNGGTKVSVSNDGVAPGLIQVSS